MTSNNKVSELLSGMRSAGEVAHVASSVSQISSWAQSKNKPFLTKNPSDEVIPSRALIGLINELMAGVEIRFGIKPGSLVERKLVRILKNMPLPVLRDWVERMKNWSPEHAEWQSLVENLTVQETYFCRDPDLMCMLEEEILPHLIQLQRHQKKLQVWSAASSTGEEVYDLVFTALRAMQKAGLARPHVGGHWLESAWGLSVLGTDISNQALRTAKAAIYGDFGMGSFRNPPTEWMSMFESVRIPPENAIADVKYFKIREQIRQCTRFERFNLMNDRPPVIGMDLVFCRNVLIYFGDPAKKAVQTMLARAMSAGGVLVIGASVQMLTPEYFDSRLGKGGPWYIRNETRI